MHFISLLSQWLPEFQANDPTSINVIEQLSKSHEETISPNHSGGVLLFYFFNLILNFGGGTL